jgi:beta-glucosidase/6-phospho-beta-glucosidase/beta-galactosidase
MFGTAVAGFQVDMGCPTLSDDACLDRNSDWYRYVTSETMIEEGRTHLSGDPLSEAAGFWETYESDLDRAAEGLNNNAFRFSIEWSRIFPEPTDDLSGFEELREAADEEALQHYHDLLEAIRDRGMTPLVTLHHYTLPLWIHRPVACHEDLESCEHRGWVDRERIVREIAKYAGFVAEEFGGKVDRWATLNEPMAVLLPGYLRPTSQRTNPPALQGEYEATQTVLRAMIEAHSRMYDAVEQHDTEDADGDGDPAFTGLVYNLAPVQPADPDSEVDQKAADNVFYLFNRVFLDATIRGEFDGNLDGEPTDRPDLEGRMDWVGINYYAQTVVEGIDRSLLPQFSPLLTFNPFELTLQYDRPKGLYEMAMFVENTYDLPVIVTENGTTIGDDPDRVSPYLVRHLDQVSRAIRDGADVRGYFYWSLVDTYEWNRGMEARMGLYGFEPSDPDKTRTKRPGASTYAEIAGAGRLPESMRNKYFDDD